MWPVFLLLKKFTRRGHRLNWSMFRFQKNIKCCLSQHVEEFIVGREECKVDPEDEGVYHFSLENTVLHDVRFA